MMLAYQPFMQRPPFAALGALPQGLPNFPQFPFGGTQFAFSPPAAQLHGAFPPAGSLFQESDSTPKSPTHEASKQRASASPKSGQSSSFSIASILGEDSDRPRRKDSCSSSHSSSANPAPRAESVSPSTPLSAGLKPNNFHYYYYPPQAPSPFHFAAVQPCLEAELQRSAMSRLSAPVAVISEIVTSAGTLLPKFLASNCTNVTYKLQIYVTKMHRGWFYFVLDNNSG